jgi:hypothetical protein
LGSGFSIQCPQLQTVNCKLNASAECRVLNANIRSLTSWKKLPSALGNAGGWGISYQLSAGSYQLSAVSYQLSVGSCHFY